MGMWIKPWSFSILSKRTSDLNNRLYETYERLLGWVTLWTITFQLEATTSTSQLCKIKGFSPFYSNLETTNQSEEIDNTPTDIVTPNENEENFDNQVTENVCDIEFNFDQALLNEIRDKFLLFYN